MKYFNHISYDMAGKQMVHVLHLIFKYLDEDAITNAELTSKDWRAAISDGNSDKLWNDLLHEKVLIKNSKKFLSFHNTKNMMIVNFTGLDVHVCPLGTTSFQFSTQFEFSFK